MILQLSKEEENRALSLSDSTPLLNGWTLGSAIKAWRTKNNGTQCLNEKGGCDYHRPLKKPDNRCAVGVYIPDGHSSAGFGGQVVSLVESFPDLLTILPLPAKFLCEAQFTHDSKSGYLADKSGWKDNVELAFRYGVLLWLEEKEAKRLEREK